MRPMVPPLLHYPMRLLAQPRMRFSPLSCSSPPTLSRPTPPPAIAARVTELGMGGSGGVERDEESERGQYRSTWPPHFTPAARDNRGQLPQWAPLVKTAKRRKSNRRRTEWRGRENFSDPGTRALEPIFEGHGRLHHLF
jgi:hypothetical protein